VITDPDVASMALHRDPLQVHLQFNIRKVNVSRTWCSPCYSKTEDKIPRRYDRSRI